MPNSAYTPSRNCVCDCALATGECCVLAQECEDTSVLNTSWFDPLGWKLIWEQIQNVSLAQWCCKSLSESCVPFWRTLSDCARVHRSDRFLCNFHAAECDKDENRCTVWLWEKSNQLHAEHIQSLTTKAVGVIKFAFISGVYLSKAASL